MNHTKYAVFTMDVEAFTDTECISNTGAKLDVDLLDGFDTYIKLLDQYNIKSTLFTVGKLAPKIADRMKKCLQNGHRLALHSYHHIAPMEQAPAVFRAEIQKAKQMLSDLFQTEIKGFRAPCFSLDKERLDILRELGFSYDSSHLGFSKARHTVDLDLSRFEQLRDGLFRQDSFYEFGLSKQNIFGHPYPVSGGGYVRLGNWDFIKGLIRQYIRNHDYYVFYLHPFELTQQKVPILKELKAYDKYYLTFGIRSYAKKVEQIIRMLQKCGYQFVTFEELAEKMEQEPLREKGVTGFVQELLKNI